MAKKSVNIGLSLDDNRNAPERLLIGYRPTIGIGTKLSNQKCKLA